jgi:hypothetical protein
MVVPRWHLFRKKWSFFPKTVYTGGWPFFSEKVPSWYHLSLGAIMAHFQNSCAVSHNAKCKKGTQGGAKMAPFQKKMAIPKWKSEGPGGPGGNEISTPANEA